MLNKIVGLVDHRNASLFYELNQDYSIQIESVSDAMEYGCYSIESSSTIYVPECNINPDSFTHELLHIYLRKRGIYIGARLKRKTQASRILSPIYTDALVEHMGNCLDHIKMLPIYLDMDFDRNNFIYDYDVLKCSQDDVKQIKKYWKHEKAHTFQVIEFYLEKYFAIQACPNPDFHYKEFLDELRQLDESLFLIQEKLVGRWSAMKITSRSDSEDDYIIIAEDYVAEMEIWVRSMSI